MEASPSTHGVSQDERQPEASPLVEGFVRRFNAGEVEALGERFGHRADWRLFAWASKLGQLEIIADDEVDPFIEERFAEIDATEARNPFREPWSTLRSAAEDERLQLILVRASELDTEGGPPVPALVFALRQAEGEQELVFATVFGELMEEVMFQGVAAVVEEGVGADPERARPSP